MSPHDPAQCPACRMSLPAFQGRREPLDLRALEERLTFGDCLDAAECGALLAHVRALRAALRKVIPSAAALKVMAEYGDAGSLMNDVTSGYREAAAVLTAATDGPPQ